MLEKRNGIVLMGQPRSGKAAVADRLKSLAGVERINVDRQLQGKLQKQGRY
jgi:predicted kinase